MVQLHIIIRSPLIQRDHLAINNCLGGQRCERSDDCRISHTEIIVVPRTELYSARAIEGEGAIAIEFVQPLSGFRQRPSAEQKHRLDERGFRLRSDSSSLSMRSAFAVIPVF